MFYLNLENQVQLLILLIFSSFVFISALAIKLTDPSLKALGLSFFIPLFLGCLSFLTAPFNMNLATLFIDSSWFLLLFVLTLISLFHKNKESVKFIFPLIFLLPLLIFVLQNMILELNYQYLIKMVLIGIIFIQMALIVYYLLSKDKSRLYLHLGIFMIAYGFLLFSTSSMLPAIGLSILGFFACAWYFYRHTYGILKAEHKKNTEALARMNNSVHLEVIRRVEEIERSNRKLVEISKTDSMTGLYVKSAVLIKLDSLLERSPTAQVSLLIFDIDNFKGINDSLGHQVGDKCIKALSTLAQSSFRQDDVLGRYGGDEFLVLLPGAPPVKAYLIADRFRNMIQTKTNPTFTISIGVATFPQDAKTSTTLVAAADKALYHSKKNGRNRVTNFGTITSEG